MKKATFLLVITLGALCLSPLSAMETEGEALRGFGGAIGGISVVPAMSGFLNQPTILEGAATDGYAVASNSAKKPTSEPLLPGRVLSTEDMPLVAINVHPRGSRINEKINLTAELCSAMDQYDQVRFDDILNTYGGAVTPGLATALLIRASQQNFIDIEAKNVQLRANLISYLFTKLRKKISAQAFDLGTRLERDSRTQDLLGMLPLQGTLINVTQGIRSDIRRGSKPHIDFLLGIFGKKIPPKDAFEFFMEAIRVSVQKVSIEGIAEDRLEFITSCFREQAREIVATINWHLKSQINLFRAKRRTARLEREARKKIGSKKLSWFIAKIEQAIIDGNPGICRRYLRKIKPNITADRAEALFVQAVNNDRTNHHVFETVIAELKKKIKDPCFGCYVALFKDEESDEEETAQEERNQLVQRIQELFPLHFEKNIHQLQKAVITGNLRWTNSLLRRVKRQISQSAAGNLFIQAIFHYEKNPQVFEAVVKTLRRKIKAETIVYGHKVALDRNGDLAERIRALFPEHFEEEAS